MHKTVPGNRRKMQINDRGGQRKSKRFDVEHKKVRATSDTARCALRKNQFRDYEGSSYNSKWGDV